MDTALTAVLGALGGGVGVAAINALAHRRKVGADTDVTLSAEAREWAATFREEMAAMSRRYTDELTALKAEVKHLEDDNGKLNAELLRVRGDMGRQVAELTAENTVLRDRITKLEAQVNGR